MNVNFLWHSYRYFPYERALAQRELTALLGQQPNETMEGFSVRVEDSWQEKAKRLTYFRAAISEDEAHVVPIQALLECSVQNGASYHLMGDMHIALKRQSTRYSAHGIHEYRGKFNPQIVRAVGNILGLEPGMCVLDPFCGSGTTLLEAVHAGWNAVGIDNNPLGILISKAKIAAMQVPIDELARQADILKQRLLVRLHKNRCNNPFTENQQQEIGGRQWQNSLPDFAYLSSWFTPSVLVQLSTILQEISNLDSSEVQLIFNVVLSDIIRDVSLQDASDLRIRRRKSHPGNIPAIEQFLHNLESKLKPIYATRKYLPEYAFMTQETVVGDARQCAEDLSSHPVYSNRLFDASITSPPYANALPYIDTQRLSLVLLGLISSEEIRTAERSLIGNREIAQRERNELDDAIDTNVAQLPMDCLLFCRQLKEAIGTSDGFRRRNTPGLLYKYLADMQRMFQQVRQVLRTGAPFAVVVGPNKTQLGGRTYIIDTPRLLASLANKSGFMVEEFLELDTYQRYDIHLSNSIRSETLLLLRN